MVETFKQKRWETPVSDAQSLAMVSLVDHSGLHIVVEVLRDSKRRRYQFSFRRVPAYRNILEEYRTSERPAGGALGLTITIPDSPWLKSFLRHEPLLEVHMPGCEHYVIVTEDDVIDVLSPEPPEIREIEPATADEPLPGKSRVLYHPEDREEIDQLIGDVKRRGQEDV